MASPIILRTGFECIKHTIPFTDGALEKGQGLAFCHIIHVEEFVDNPINSLIKARCIRQTSINESPYQLEIELGGTRQVTRVQCDCIARETGECKHLAASIHRINNDRSVSKTSVDQEWGIPSVHHLCKEKYSRGMAVDDLIPQFVPKRPRQPHDIRVEHLTNICCPIKRRLMIDNISEEERVCVIIMNITLQERENEIALQCVNDIVLHLVRISDNMPMIGNTSLIMQSDIAVYYRKHIFLCNKAVAGLCLRTAGQSESREWFEARRIRITASKKAHQIKTMIRTTAEVLLGQFLNPKKLDTPSLSYGVQSEGKARDSYKKLHDVYVFEIGLYVSPRQPWLGVSVDGVVVDNGRLTRLVEIKCPISCRSRPIWDIEASKSNVGYIVMIDGTLQLKISHQYYTQCQLQMYVTGLPKCDLYVWSPRGSCTVEVFIDYEFLKMLLPKLENFYFNKYLNGLCNEQKENVIDT